MKLDNSEVLLLSQILFHVKSLPTHNWASEELIDKLYNKLNNHLVPNFSNVTDEDSSQNYLDQESCVWHDDDTTDSILQENCEDQVEQGEAILVSKLLDLEPLRVEFDGKRTFLFEKGISKNSVDINLDDGAEVLCDVTEIERFSESFNVNSVNGWVTFEVTKFPKSWTSLLQTKTLYKVTYE